MNARIPDPAASAIPSVFEVSDAGSFFLDLQDRGLRAASAREAGRPLTYLGVRVVSSPIVPEGFVFVRNHRGELIEIIRYKPHEISDADRPEA